MRRKKQARSNKQTNKAKQHSTPKAVTFPRKNELPRVGLEPTTLYTLDRALYQLSWMGPNLTSLSTPDEQANHQLSMKETCTTTRATTIASVPGLPLTCAF